MIPIEGYTPWWGIFMVMINWFVNTFLAWFPGAR